MQHCSWNPQLPCIVMGTEQTFLNRRVKVKYFRTSYYPSFTDKKLSHRWNKSIGNLRHVSEFFDSQLLGISLHFCLSFFKKTDKTLLWKSPVTESGKECIFFSLHTFVLLFIIGFYAQGVLNHCVCSSNISQFSDIHYWQNVSIFF